MPLNPRKVAPPVETRTRRQRDRERAKLVDRCCRTAGGRDYVEALHSIADPYQRWGFTREPSQMLGVPNGESYPNRQVRQQWLGKEKARRRDLALTTPPAGSSSADI